MIKWILNRLQIKQLLYEHCLTGRIDKQLLMELFNALNVVVPVVRCKDCRYNYANMIPGGNGCQQNVYVETADDWYCADGERVDEVEE